MQNQYDYFVNLHGTPRILGIFGYGDINYGFAANKKEIKTTLIYIPTFEELCTSAASKSHIIDLDGNEIFFTDIRDAYDLNNQQTANMVEVLYTPYAIVNPYYKDAFEAYLYNKRDEIMLYNRTSRIRNMLERAEQIFNNYYTVLKPPYLIYQGARLLLAAELFAQEVPVVDCILLNRSYHVKYLQEIKDGLVIPPHSEMKKIILNTKYILKDYPVNEHSRELVKEGVFTIVKMSFNYGISELDFVSSLTNTEQEAFNMVKSYLTNGIGMISVNRLIEESKISRPVFKNLFRKMEAAHVAEITNRGVKGTQVKLLI